MCNQTEASRLYITTSFIKICLFEMPMLANTSAAPDSPTERERERERERKSERERERPIDS